MSDTNGFIVRRRVWGGVTGTREAVCKRDGEPIIFPSYEDAQAYARDCNGQRMHCNHHAWVEQAGPVELWEG